MSLLLVTSPNQVNGEGKVKDAIVNVLRSEWPLSLKEIYFAVVREYSLRVSHQAVHKALKKLVKNKVLVRHERKYCLNLEWIREVKQFGTSLEKVYTQPVEEILQSRTSDFTTNSTFWLKKNQPTRYKEVEKKVYGGSGGQKIA